MLGLETVLALFNLLTLELEIVIGLYLGLGYDQGMEF